MYSAQVTPSFRNSNFGTLSLPISPDSYFPRSITDSTSVHRVRDTESGWQPLMLYQNLRSGMGLFKLPMPSKDSENVCLSGGEPLIYCLLLDKFK